MAPHQTPRNSNARFGQLLTGAINSIATYEGKTATIVEEELGMLMHVAGKTVQRYKAGHLPPDSAQIPVLAEAAVQRGFLERAWLQRFLHAARYPFAEKLLDQLCPLGPVRPRPPRVYENLPAPTYSQFVMRKQAFADVLDGLQQRSAVVLIVGLGGNGKTSLAREIASACLKDGDGPRFDAVVWISDKDRPGTTNLSVVLDEVARTLDYPGFTQFDHEEKRREVEQLLRRQRVLLVVDNFETVTDGALLTWLLRLPEPSKALITSREYSRAFRNSTVALDLRGMSDVEVEAFVALRLHMLRLDPQISDQAQLELLVTITCRNPKAIEIALGLVKHEHRPLQQVVDDLYAARGELFDDLFARAWSLLTEDARRVLLIMTFFPTRAGAVTLAATADVQGYSFDRVIEQLTDLALLDVQHDDLTNGARYTLHPLVRVFASTRLEERTEFAQESRKRWMQWYLHHAAAVGYCWNDLQKLDLLDTEAHTLHTVMSWCFTHAYFTEVLQLIKEVFFYYHVRGLWHRQPSMYIMAATAARHLENRAEEIRYLALQLKYLNWQDNQAEADALVERLRTLETIPQLPQDVYITYRQALALYHMDRQDLDTAQHILRETIASCRDIEDKQSYNATKHWLAACLYKKGLLMEAEQLLKEAIQDAELWNIQRATFAHPRWLIAIYLDQHKLDAAEQQLTHITPRINQFNDRRYRALTQRLYARLHTLRGDFPAAHAALTEAIDLFERLGMRRELAEARQALADLDAGATHAA